MDRLPLPPVELALRVGVPDQDRPLESYERLGRDSRELVLDLLPADWSFEGKRVLDFGAGAGKVLRHFAAEAKVAEFHGCDIDGPSIDWLKRELCPPFHAFRNGERPPLPVPDDHYDLVLALSVFTHLTRTWRDWLLELHRVLRADGLLIATFLGKAAYEAFTGKPYDERRIGMKVLNRRQSWDLGGPTVFHSERWLRENWGQAFDFVELRQGRSPGEHGVALLRAKPLSTRRTLRASLRRPRRAWRDPSKRRG